MNPKTIQGRDAVPARKGKIYCSPWCGASCTRAAYSAACKKADALGKKLGEGWAPYVWENMGWLYSATSIGKTNVVVHPVPDGYVCFFNASKQFLAQDKDPRVAVRLAYAQCEQFEKALALDRKRFMIASPEVLA